MLVHRVLNCEIGLGKGPGPPQCPVEWAGTSGGGLASCGPPRAQVPACAKPAALSLRMGTGLREAEQSHRTTQLVRVGRPALTLSLYSTDKETEAQSQGMLPRSLRGLGPRA